MPGTVLNALNQWLLKGCDCVPSGHLEVSGDSFDCLGEQDREGGKEEFYWHLVGRGQMFRGS